MTMRKFDAVLLEKDDEHGLTKSDVQHILRFLPDEELLTVITGCVLSQRSLPKFAANAALIFQLSPAFL